MLVAGPNAVSVTPRNPAEAAAGRAADMRAALVPVPPVTGWDPDRLIEALRGPVRIADLEREVAGGDADRLVALHVAIQVLVRNGRLAFASAPEQPMMTVTPMTRHFVTDLAPVDDDHPYRLSRFAYLHRGDDGELVLESPRSLARVVLHDGELASVLSGFAGGASIDELDRVGLGRFRERKDELRAIVLLLRMASMVDRCDASGATAEDRDDALRQWEFHDLLFHGRSRNGRHDHPMGGLYRFKGEIEPQPALKPNPWRGAGIPLPRQATDGPRAGDPPFSAVVEARQSVRQQGLAPITIGQLGEFLFRVARVRGVVATESGELSNRPYPNGGASYELELYLTIDRCAGVAPGFYYYDPAAHVLCLVTPPNDDTRMLLHEAYVSSAQQTLPQVLITIASRFQRVSWKYSGIAYATQLKNTGVLYGVMYLMATAMGLAPCGLGLGNSERFCRLAGTSPFAEASIGEFMLGSRLAGP